ncbi:MSHA biogenesis protein MshJ [Oleispira antarctica RB-8]|uniref:MSHA biogenesis protein MshJ n=1 Tax=Oleispira antarctica RB-8 TaxID=698738 RepID=R4YR13_OLEAN|nr:MSHA biogenesis protein MshJ [Oleispira antarctica RB-8]
MTWWQKKPFIDAINAYEKFSAREKKIILSTLVMAFLLIGYLFLIEPIILTSTQLINEKSRLVNSNKSLSEQIMNTKNKESQDPNIPLRKQLNELLVESDKLQEKINLLTQALVAPRQMVGLLEKVLTQDKQLKLISLKNLPEEAMSIEGRTLASDSRPVGDGESIKKLKLDEEALIYRHTFEIELEATYDSALLYLKRLDSLPWQLFWQDLKYQSTQYPKGILNIRIYTLSMSKEVLGV